MLFLGMDLGSSGCKASVFDENGTLKYSACRSYSFSHTPDGRSELDPKLLLDAAFEVFAELGEKYDMSELATLSADSFGEMFVTLDENGDPIGNSISYNDIRGEVEANELEAAVGADRLYAVTGATAHGMYALPKLMWIKRHEPKRYEKTARIHLFADYLLTALGATPHTDHSLAARTLCFDVTKKEWSGEILSAAGISPSLFTKAVAPGTPVGQLAGELAKRFHFPENVILIAGAHDQVAAAMGVGALTPGTVLDGMGSNECLVPCFDRPLINSAMRESNLVCVPHALPGRYVTYAFNSTAGSAWKWYCDLMREGYASLLTDLPAAPTDMFFVPHMAGAATPYMDDRAEAALIGMTLGSDRGQITKAILEGLNFEMMVNLECLRKAGFEVKELYCTGGMARSDEIMQLKADMLGLPAVRCGTSESGARGLILGGLVEKGICRDLNDAARRVSAKGDRFIPNEALSKVYAKRFDIYRQYYPTLRSVEKIQKAVNDNE